MTDTCKVTSTAEMGNDDVGAMNELFHKLMDEEMHIEIRGLCIDRIQ